MASKPDIQLSLLLSSQASITAILCTVVVLYTSTTSSAGFLDENGKDNSSFEYLSVATWILSQWNFSVAFQAVTIALFVFFWVAMHVSLKLAPNGVVKSKKYEGAAIITMTIAYVGFSLVTAIFFACASAEAVCDPLVRLIMHDGGDVQMLPLSSGSVMESEQWVGESSPPPKGSTPCVAYTSYAQEGQDLVVISAGVCVAAFIFSIVMAHMRPPSSASLAVIHCGLVVAFLGCSSQVVLNGDSWDWRVVNSLLTAFGASAYLAACVVTGYGDPGELCSKQAALIYVQLLVACEEVALRLTSNS
jgi:hypothetical protein